MEPDRPTGPAAGPPPTIRTPPAGDTLPPEADAFLADFGLAASSVGNTDFEPAPDPPPPDIPGYELLAELGRGGMGVVFQARDVRLNRLVAVKMIRPDARPGFGDLIRFQAEAEAVAAVKHPNVVEVYTSGRVGERPYFVMEFVGGGTLAARLAAGRLAPAAAAGLVAAVARGVDAAHAAGVVHRDLKPGNILLAVGSGQWAVGGSESPRSGSSPSTAHRPLPTAKVADFGLAKRLAGGSGLTRTVVLMGTPAYMAPEQARGEGKFVGPEADVYALGVILYECLTGRPPFAADDPIALVRLVADAAPAPVRAIVPGVPRDLDLICAKAMAKVPTDRYAAAADLAADLDAFLAGRPVAARPIPAAVRAVRWAKRNRAAAALVLLLAAAVTAGPALGVWYADRLGTLETDARTAGERQKAAEQLAAARELAGLEGTIGRRSAERATGWTWENRADLARAAPLAADNPPALAALRAEAAAALFAPDLRPADPVARGFTAGTAAAGPDGRVALGTNNTIGAGLLGPAAPIEVRLVDPAGDRPAVAYSFPAGWVKKDGGLAPDRVTALAFAPDGTALFVGTRSERVVRLDLTGTGGPPKEWKTPAIPGYLVATADSVIGCCENYVVRWDAATGAERARFTATGRAGGAAVVPDTGDVLAALPGGLARGPAATLAFPAPVGGGGRRPVVFPDGLIAAAGNGPAVELWDAAAPRPVGRFTDPDLLDRAAHADNVTWLAAHPSGAYLATADDARAVRVWAVASGRPVAGVQLGGTGPAALAWSADGRDLFATGPGETARFEFAAPAAERYAGFRPVPLAAAAFHPAGGLVGLTDPAGDPERATLFRTTPRTELPIPRQPGAGPPGLAVSPAAGTVGLLNAGGGVGDWRPAGPPSPDRLTDSAARGAAYSADGATIWAVVDSSAVKAWDGATRRPRGPGWTNTPGAVLTGVGALDALAGGRAVAAAGGADGAVHLLDTTAKLLGTAPGGRDPVHAVAVSPDDAEVAAGTLAGRLRLVRVADRAELPGAAGAHAGGVTAASYSADGAVLATGGRDRAVRFWRRGAGGAWEPAAAVTGLPAPVRSLSFARPGSGLLVLLAGERAARVWDVAALRAQLAELGLGW